MTDQATAEHALIRHQGVGTAFEGVYYVESVFVKQTVQKKDYSDFMLRDRSGSRNVKFWGVVQGVAKGDFIFIAANVEEYQGNPSVIAKNVEKTDPPGDLSNYIPVYEDSDKNAGRFDQIRAALKELETKTGHQTAGLLVDEVYKNSTFFQKFVVSPGSARPHYGRQGGLLANTVRVAEGALRGAESYRLNDQEKMVLIASALLVRIGAIDAFEFQDCMPVVTKKGLLLGINNLTMTRISSALKRVVGSLSRESKTPDQEMVVRILHAVSSHDGLCVQPMTREALVLNASFTTDVHVVDAMDFIEADANVTEEFTAYDPAMRRRYYTGIRATA
jgi:23S rRNA maturation-related 3'-5' exoribonuclease YhaM